MAWPRASGGALIDESDAMEARADRLLSHDSEQTRAAFALVMAANLTTASHRGRGRCEQALRQCFNDPSTRVRDAAARFFRHLRDDGWREFAELIEAFIASQAFSDGRHWFTQALEKSSSIPTELVHAIFERGIELVRRSLGRRDEVMPGIYRRLPPSPLLRLHERDDSEQGRRQCLDLIDEMFRLGIGSRLEEAIRPVERS